MAILRFLPIDSAFVRLRASRREETYGDAFWGLNEQLLAALIDNFNLLRWELAGCRGTAPKPIARPGIDTSSAAGDDTVIGAGTVMTLEEAERFRDVRRRGEYLT